MLFLSFPLTPQTNLLLPCNSHKLFLSLECLIQSRSQRDDCQSNTSCRGRNCLFAFRGRVVWEGLSKPPSLLPQTFPIAHARHLRVAHQPLALQVPLLSISFSSSPSRHLFSSPHCPLCSEVTDRDSLLSAQRLSPVTQAPKPSTCKSP